MGAKRIKSIFSLKVFAIIFSVGLILFPVSSQAAYLLFDIPGNSIGSIKYDGGAKPLVGLNIPVNSVEGFGTSNDIVTTITNGILNFTTGNLSGWTPYYQWIFSGGTITLTGNIGQGGVTLFSGNFNQAFVIAGSSGFRFMVGSFIDNKDSSLTKIYGLPDIPYDGNLSLNFLASALPPNPFNSSKIFSGEIYNTPIPIPTTLLLLASGVLGLIGLSRKLKNRTV